jgi:hypothetical protein
MFQNNKSNNEVFHKNKENVELNNIMLLLKNKENDSNENDSNENDSNKNDRNSTSETDESEYILTD